jgi:hypothetical protein
VSEGGREGGRECVCVCEREKEHWHVLIPPPTCDLTRFLFFLVGSSGCACHSSPTWHRTTGRLTRARRWDLDHEQRLKTACPSQVPNGFGSLRSAGDLSMGLRSNEVLVSAFGRRVRTGVRQM